MDAPSVRILNGHVLDHLRELPNASVHCVVTSPPYWGLRDYSRCECAIKRPSDFGIGSFQKDGSMPPGIEPKLGRTEPDPSCPKCHGTGKDESLELDWPDGWHGQLGLEPTPELYVRHIVQVFQEVKRILRDDGTLWLNMGDCYYGGKGASNYNFQNRRESDTLNSDSQVIEAEIGGMRPTDAPQDGLKPKDLIGMPWRVAFALQADGWYLRSDIIWAKPNPMPESVTDRPTKAHEYVFLLSKSARYYYDANAVREENSPTLGGRQLAALRGEVATRNKDPSGGSLSPHRGLDLSEHGVGRNLRSVWTIPTQPYPEAHFATFPEALAERCIKAGTSEKGCCPVCGAAWERIVEKTGGSIGKAWHDHNADESIGQRIDAQDATHGRHGHEPYAVNSVGFRPPCDHGPDPVPCTVLDPFGGSGTTGAVARSLGRSCILIEIKEQYIELANDRVRSYLHPLEGYERESPSAIGEGEY